MTRIGLWYIQNSFFLEGIHCMFFMMQMLQKQENYVFDCFVVLWW